MRVFAEFKIFIHNHFVMALAQAQALALNLAYVDVVFQ
jgi:hypothetical protein